MFTKSETASLAQGVINEWGGMLERGCYPVMEFSYNEDSDFVTVFISINSDPENLKFTFEIDGPIDATKENTYFSGDVTCEGSNTFSIAFDPYFDNLDHYLQQIDLEVLEGYLIPNELID